MTLLETTAVAATTISLSGVILIYGIACCIAGFVRRRRRMERMEQERKDRSLGQPLYLIDASHTRSRGWNILVEGASGRSYHVFLGKSKCSCSCPDFVGRNKVCKHIYFVIGRVAKMSDLLRRMRSSPSAFRLTNELCDALKHAVTPRTTRASSVPNLLDALGEEEDREECCICFDELAVDPDTQECPFCAKQFHLECMERWWRRGNATCPMCRGMFPRPVGVVMRNDCFAKFRARHLASDSNLVTLHDLEGGDSFFSRA